VTQVHKLCLYCSHYFSVSLLHHCKKISKRSEPPITTSKKNLTNYARICIVFNDTARNTMFSMWRMRLHLRGQCCGPWLRNIQCNTCVVLTRTTITLIESEHNRWRLEVVKFPFRLILTNIFMVTQQLMRSSQENSLIIA